MFWLLLRRWLLLRIREEEEEERRIHSSVREYNVMLISVSLLYGWGFTVFVFQTLNYLKKKEKKEEEDDYCNCLNRLLYKESFMKIIVVGDLIQ